MFQLLPLLIIPVVSPLVKGQDPYAILGIERSATQQQIKTAFRQKTKKFHPDRNKEPDAQKKWMQVSDAYELLSDPKMKERYDKFGMIDESLEEPRKTGSDRADKIRDILAKESSYRSGYNSYGEFGRKQKVDPIVSLDDTNFQLKTADGRPWIIYIFNHEHEFERHRTIFEDLFQRTGMLFGIAKMKASVSPQATKALHVSSAPQLVVYDSNRTSHYTGSSMTVRSITKFAAYKFGADVTSIYSDQDIATWRKRDLDKLHVLLFSDLMEAPSSYELVAAFLKRTATFAFAHVDQQTLEFFPGALGSLELDQLPTYIIYRMGTPRDDTFGGPVTPLVAPLDLDAGALSAIIRKYPFPVFAELNSQNLPRLCPEMCIVYCRGVEMADDIKRGVNDMNIATGALNLTLEREFQEQFGLEPGDFFVFKPKEARYTVWKDLTSWAEFRRKLEFLQHGLTKMTKVDTIPKLTDPVSSEFHRTVITIGEKMTSIKFLAVEYYDKLRLFLRSLPASYLLILLSVVLIAIGELFSLCFRSRSRPIDPA